jgi:hypothetical protein
MPCAWQGTGWRHVRDDSDIRLTSELTVGREEVVFEREVEINAWATTPDKVEGYVQIADNARRNAATLWARPDLEGNIQPLATASTGAGNQRDARSYRWAAVFLIVPLLGLLSQLSNPHKDVVADGSVGPPLITTTGNLLDRSTHSSFVAAPEAHVSSFNRMVESSLESCIETGRDSVGPFLHNGCPVSANVRVARPYGGEPWEGTISPGAKAYVYFLELFGSNAVGAFAACPSADQIVETRSGLPWTTRGTGYRCQHSLP